LVTWQRSQKYSFALDSASALLEAVASPFLPPEVDGGETVEAVDEEL
jgi:hypothetical protein